MRKANRGKSSSDLNALCAPRSSRGMLAIHLRGRPLRSLLTPSKLFPPYTLTITLRIISQGKKKFDLFAESP